LPPSRQPGHYAIFAFIAAFPPLRRFRHDSHTPAADIYFISSIFFFASDFAIEPFFFGYDTAFH